MIKARWSELDLKNRTWTIPAGRMKAGKEHRVPLTDRVVAILEELPCEDGSEFVFIGIRKGAPLTEYAMLHVLRSLRPGLTVHGFRSSFRDWAAEKTHYPNYVVEKALAHAVADKVEAAYRRGDLFEKRRALMEQWASFCARPAPADEVVVPFPQAGAP